MYLPPEGFGEDHGHSRHIAKDLIFSKDSLAFSDGFELDLMEGGSRKANYCFLAFINSSRASNDPHWLSTVLYLYDRRVQLNKVIHVLPFSLLFQCFLSSGFQMFAYPRHSLPQSEAVNSGILQSNVKLDIGKGFLSIFKER